VVQLSYLKSGAALPLYDEVGAEGILDIEPDRSGREGESTSAAVIMLNTSGIRCATGEVSTLPTRVGQNLEGC
jgi:hypothetical protein